MKKKNGNNNLFRLKAIADMTSTTLKITTICLAAAVLELLLPLSGTTTVTALINTGGGSSAAQNYTLVSFGSSSSPSSSTPQHYITKDDLDLIFDLYHARCTSLCRAALGGNTTSSNSGRRSNYYQGVDDDDEGIGGGGDDRMPFYYTETSRSSSRISTSRGRGSGSVLNDDESDEHDNGGGGGSFCATDERRYDSQCALQCMNKHIEFVYKSLGMHKRFVDDVVPQVEVLCYTDCARCLRGNFLPPPRMGPVIRANSMNDVALSSRRRQILQRMRSNFYHCESVCAAYSSSNKICGSDGREYYKGNNCHLACANKMLTSLVHNPLLRIFVVCEPRTSESESCATCAQRMQLTLLYDQLINTVEQTATHHIGAPLPHHSYQQLTPSGASSAASSSPYINFEAIASRSRQPSTSVSASPQSRAASAVKQRGRVCKFCRPDSDAVDCERHYMDYACSWIANDADTRWCLKITGTARFGGKQSSSLGGGPARWQEFTYRSCYSKNVQRLLSALYAIDEDDVKLGECNEVERQSANVTICTCNEDFCNNSLKLLASSGMISSFLIFIVLISIVKRLS